ncbi:MAG: nitrilase-related carbon-nitrogen hydrolase [Chitinivibrionales bacterium]
MIVAGIQMDIVWEDREANLNKASLLADEASDNGADTLVFPEMFSTGFSMDTDKTAETREGATYRFLKETATQNGLWVVAGLVLKNTKGKPSNDCCVIDPEGREKGLYSKNKLFRYGKEHHFYQPGTSTETLLLNGIKSSLFICFDLRYPGLIRETAYNTHACFIIASWPEPRTMHWETLLRARAIENQMFVIGINRTGPGRDLSYSGHSAVISPTGEYLAKAGSNEEIIYADINPESVVKTRRKWPFLKE